MRTVNLKEIIKYSPSTGIFRWRESRGNQYAGEGVRAGYVSSRGYRVIEIGGVRYLEHRLAWLLHYGKTPQKQIDHINGDRADNRISNLRESDNRDNSGNRECHRNGKLVGACYFKARDNWMSTIRHQGKSLFLGYYPSEIEAHTAYICAKKIIQRNPLCSREYIKSKI